MCASYTWRVYIRLITIQSISCYSCCDSLRLTLGNDECHSSCTFYWLVQLMRFTGLMIESRPPLTSDTTPGGGLDNRQLEAYVQMPAEVLIFMTKRSVRFQVMLIIDRRWVNSGCYCEAVTAVRVTISDIVICALNRVCCHVTNTLYISSALWLIWWHDCEVCHEATESASQFLCYCSHLVILKIAICGKSSFYTQLILIVEQ